MNVASHMVDTLQYLGRGMDRLLCQLRALVKCWLQGFVDDRGIPEISDVFRCFHGCRWLQMVAAVANMPRFPSRWDACLQQVTWSIAWSIFSHKNHKNGCLPSGNQLHGLLENGPFISVIFLAINLHSQGIPAISTFPCGFPRDLRIFPPRDLARQDWSNGKSDSGPAQRSPASKQRMGCLIWLDLQ